MSINDLPADEASKWIRSLNLVQHPEGGFYKETYRSDDVIPAGTFGSRFSGPRSACTSIFYLVTVGNFSAFHRIRSDEIWHFYAGGPLELHQLHQGVHSPVLLGKDVQSGQQLQYFVPAGAWFASAPAPGSAFSLLGCTVSPGFDFADFELAERGQLIKEYPNQAELIAKLTRINPA